MKKYDKSLMEVWEWKDKVYTENKDLKDEEYLRKIKAETDKILADYQVDLKTVALKAGQKVA